MTKDPYRYFRVEARELLDGLTEGILLLEKGPAPEMTANGPVAAPTLPINVPRPLFLIVNFFAALLAPTLVGRNASFAGTVNLPVTPVPLNFTFTTGFFGSLLWTVNVVGNEPALVGANWTVTVLV